MGRVLQGRTATGQRLTIVDFECEVEGGQRCGVLEKDDTVHVLKQTRGDRTFLPPMPRRRERNLQKCSLLASVCLYLPKILNPLQPLHKAKSCVLLSVGTALIRTWQNRIGNLCP